MVFCTYCGQRFTRDEHLERHILTHTNVKPFKCFTCHMSFARRDLLQRHYTVHGRNENNQEGISANASMMVPKSAGRTPIACHNCAKTKTKCDKKFPCSRCAARGLRCTARPTRRTSKNVAARMPTPGESGNSSDQSTNDSNNNASTAGNSPQPPMQSPEQHPLPPPLQSPMQEPQPQHQQQMPQMQAHVGSQFPSPELKMSDQHPMFKPSPASTNGHLTAASSPEFLEWPAAIQMPPGFDHSMGRDYLMDNPMLNLDPLHVSSPDGAMMPIISDAGMSMPSVQTPRMEPPYADIDMGSNAHMSGQAFYSPSRHASIAETALPDIQQIVAAQEGWSNFRCNPTVPSHSCPRTARANLERLEQSLRNHEGWSNWRPNWNESDFAPGEHMSVIQMQESTRDKLLAITQTFLHKALEIHREGLGASASADSPAATGSNFVLLPPARVLEYFLRSYANSFERYYPLTSRGTLDANETLHCANDKAASLLTLLMIAQGAMVIPSVEARWLTGGLTETCRISLFDHIEKNIIMSGDPVVLHSALLFIVQAAWSGDKWQMDIAMGQRGMYTAMLRHSGALEPHQPTAGREEQTTPESVWNNWRRQESRSRLAYSWVMVDQELSLFHDTAPVFLSSEFESAPMPEVDRLWQAKTAGEWLNTFSQVQQELAGGAASASPGGHRPPSLNDFFQHVYFDDGVSQGIQLTSLRLRLLLHPIQGYVCDYRQRSNLFNNTLGRQHQNANVAAAAVQVRLDEVRMLLRRWFDLATAYMKNQTPCAMMQSNLAMYHLVSLNVVTDFPEIEKLARKDGMDEAFQQPQQQQQLVWMHKRCIADAENTIYHCGQILRLVRQMPKGIRPPWWAAAIYRVALILRAEILSRTPESLTPPSSGLFPVKGPTFSADQFESSHPLITRYLSTREGAPTLTKLDGSPIPIDNVSTVLSYCVDVINEGVATRFTDGIKGKLERLRAA
ncbi:hypothetical protein BDY21DRAFT_282165 [Lineolata rhizophorae]|uniref:Transcription factor Cmr1 n=1 Tax=Lineolata rhizophorae TaxID=578093 RepID=A0A6A6P7L3_9PEZI|nr:hypothetical protein BDY21DRAFT_282165 [Lineolata rhizophorae]